MRTRIAFLLVVPLFVVLTLLAAMSGECGGGGSCIATARVNDNQYSISLARGMSIDAGDLTPYALAAKRAKSFDVVDEQTYQLGSIDPRKVLVMKIAPGPSMDPAIASDYLILVRFGDPAAWDLTCPYFETADPGRPSGCP